MIAALRDMTFDAKGRAILSLTLEGDFREEFDKLHGKRLDMTLKEYKPKRSTPTPTRCSSAKSTPS